MDDRALFELAARQHGLVTDAQAGALGYPPDALWRRARAGAWVRVLPGVLRSAAAPVTFSQTAMAAVALGPTPSPRTPWPEACGASTARPGPTGDHAPGVA